MTVNMGMTIYDDDIDEDDIDVNNDKNVDEKDNFGDDVDNVGIKNKNEDYDKTGKYNDVDDDQTFESSG